MSIPWQRNSEALEFSRPKREGPAIRHFTGQLVQLSEADMAFFMDRYEIPPLSSSKHIRYSPESSRYALPIWGPTNAERGMVLRLPWQGAPRIGAYGLKADTYKGNAEPLQSHYWADNDADGAPYYPSELVLVEDQLSAIKLAAYGYDTVALLGVPDVRYNGYSGADRVAEIARRAKDQQVLVALDSDATELAFLFARKWGSAFSSIRVVMLSRDLKDTPANEFTEVLGV